MNTKYLHRKYSLFTTLVLGASLFAQNAAMAYDKQSFAQQRKVFIAAEQALKRGQITRYRRLAARLEDYPLYPYLKYQRMRSKSIRLITLKFRISWWKITARPSRFGSVTPGFENWPDANSGKPSRKIITWSRIHACIANTPGPCLKSMTSELRMWPRNSG